eukprot:TRINITY_DN10724_c0_g1_i2.p1 TRINITY_DN10724_c0_g1~~TRINITY_DN10724_c0_g1_i2.p1  ORF type:complete len:210 (+),score=17.13 TRINITY_DN10724_c0_g1_i2:34-630(+)
MRLQRPKRRVQNANDAKDLMSLCSNKYQRVFRGKEELKVECLRPDEINETHKLELMDLLESNMKESYDLSPKGWSRSDKEDEMFDPCSRHLILFHNNHVAAFSHFRFDMDYGVDVIYCYEIHIQSNWQRKGLGRFLMEILEQFLCLFSLTKIVLTVFKSNSAAIDFYTKIGFSIDETSPDDTYYLIMSKLNASHQTVS